MNQYKLIVMDMDGTLTNSEKKITPKTREALIKAQQMGIKLVLASGRPTRGLLREAGILEMNTYGGMLISFNGAKVMDFSNESIIYNDALPEKFIPILIAQARAHDMGIMVNHNEFCVVEDKNCYKLDYETNACCLKKKVVNDLITTINYPINKILLAAPEEHVEKVFDAIKEPFKDDLSIYCSAPFYIEIMNKGINKGIALDKVAKYMNVQPEEIIVFGDEHNDLEMIEYAGYGVAMGNAIDAVKKVADEVTLSNDEDGIAYTLSKLFEEISF